MLEDSFAILFVIVGLCHNCATFLQAIVNGISATEIVPGRCEVIDEEQEFGVVIDAANTPESLSRLLDSIREAGARKIFLVFGCEGGGDKEKRPFMGEIAHYKVPWLLFQPVSPKLNYQLSKRNFCQHNILYLPVMRRAIKKFPPKSSESSWNLVTQAYTRAPEWRNALLLFSFFWANVLHLWWLVQCRRTQSSSQMIIREGKDLMQ